MDFISILTLIKRQAQLHIKTNLIRTQNDF